MDFALVNKTIMQKRRLIEDEVIRVGHCSSYRLADAAKRMKEVEKLEAAYALLYNLMKEDNNG